MIHLSGQPVDPVNCGVKIFDGGPQGRLVFADLLGRSACRGERREVETHVGPRPGHRCPQGPECHDDIGNKRRIPVGRQPLKVLNGTDGVLAEYGRGLGGVHGSPAYRILPLRPRIHPEGGAESLGR